jgi:hypothetical protein
MLLWAQHRQGLPRNESRCSLHRALSSNPNCEFHSER